MVIPRKSVAEPEQISFVSEARKHFKSINIGLDTFQLIPKYKSGGNNLAGDAAFVHGVAFRNVHMGKKGTFRIECSPIVVDIEVGGGGRMEYVHPREK